MNEFEEYVEKIYTVTLTDGTVLLNLRMNGNNFISAEPVTDETFVDNLDPVTISDGEYEDQHEHMALIYTQRRGDEYWFALRDRTPDELARLKIQSDIEYLAMMTDIEL